MSVLLSELELNRSISKNFKYSEMCLSGKARSLGIKNIPTQIEANHIKELVEKILQPLRDELGLVIKVNSGFRNQKVNALVGGVKNSAHLSGYAADIHCPGYKGGSIKELCLYIEQFLKSKGIKFDQLIYEYGDKNIPTKGWVHIGIRDLGGYQRNEVITINKKGKFNGIVD